MPVACDSVACEPASEDDRNFCVVPDVANAPTVLVVPFFSLTVPLLNVNARDEPCVRASWNVHTPPAPAKVSGKSNVLPATVIVLLDAVD